jgi:glycosyltransferase involved in cell wall biosynthesis
LDRPETAAQSSAPHRKAPEASVAAGSKAAVVVPVSVIIPSYRRKSYLSQAVASIAAQEHVQPMEVIVIDDGSRDGTAELAASLGARVIEKARSERLGAARHDGVSSAVGAEWVAMLDDDDQWLPHHLHTLWSQRDDHVMVGGTAVTFGGGVPKVHGCPKEVAEVVRSPARLVFPANSFPASATLVRRDVLLAAGNFDRGLRYVEDLDTWLRVLEYGTGLLLPEITCLYRVHPDQISKNRPEMLASAAAVMAKYADRAWLTRRVREGSAVVEAWDNFQAARAGRDWAKAFQEAAWLIGRPTRTVALAKVWMFRRQIRHRSVPPEIRLAVREATDRSETNEPTRPAGGAD